MPRRTLLVWGCLASVYLFWGGTYLAIRVMVETFPPLLGSAARFVLAGAVFAAWLAARNGLGVLRVSRRELLAALAIGVLLLGGGNGGVTIAEQEAPSGLAALIIASVPLWVVLFRMVTRERVSRVTLAAVALGFAGIALLVAPGGRPGNAALWSLVVLIAAAAAWATGSFMTGRVPLPRDLFVAAALQMLLGGLVLGAAGLVAGEANDVHADGLSGRSIAAFLYLVIFGSLVAFTAYVWLLKNVPISTVTTYAFVNPIVAVFLGWAVLDEEITGTVVLATAVIVTSVAFVVRQETTEPEAEAAPGEIAEALDAAEPR